MKIEGSKSIFAGNSLSGNEKNSALTGIEKQIQRTQDELSKLSENETMNVKEKLDKRKKLEEQLLELNKQLVQKQMEEKRAEQEKRAEEIQEQVEATTAVNNKEEDLQTGLSKRSMQSMISAGSSMEEAKTINHVRTQMNGEAHIIKGQIAIEESRGGNPEELRKQLESLEKRIDGVTADLIGKYAEAVDYMKKAVTEDKSGAKSSDETLEESEGDDDIRSAQNVSETANEQNIAGPEEEGIELLV